MTDFVDDTELDELAAFEALGRRAGAELRTSAPAPSLDDLERAVRRRMTTRVVAGTVVVVALLAVGLMALRGHLGRNGEPADQTPVPTIPLPVGQPGTWRELAAPATVPGIVVSAIWTGDEVVVLGMEGQTEPTPDALAYDIRRGTWRTLAPWPDRLMSGLQAAWTGSEVLVANATGEVYSLDPQANTWRRRSAPPVGVEWPDAGGLVAVSEDGVLAHAQDQWLWYDQSADTWTTAAPPPASFDAAAVVQTTGGPTASLSVLTPSEFVLTRLRAGIEFATFDPSTDTWSRTVEADDPPTPRGGPMCAGIDGRLVCFSEGFGTLYGVVIDPSTGSEQSFSLDHTYSMLGTAGTPWFGHAWSILLARTAEWETLPPLEGTQGFNTAIWDGKELLMFGGMTDSGTAASQFAAAYTPVALP